MKLNHVDISVNFLVEQFVDRVGQLTRQSPEEAMRVVAVGRLAREVLFFELVARIVDLRRKAEAECPVFDFVTGLVECIVDVVAKLSRKCEERNAPLFVGRGGVHD